MISTAGAHAAARASAARSLASPTAGCAPSSASPGSTPTHTGASPPALSQPDRVLWLRQRPQGTAARGIAIARPTASATADLPTPRRPVSSMPSSAPLAAPVATQRSAA
eukprot:3048139-Prymnesium_polylepis.1